MPPSAHTIDVLLFASAAEAVGAPSVRLTVAAGATAADVRAAVADLAGAAGAAPVPASWRIAVNQRFAEPDEPVREGDEVAVIPPVAGG